MTFPRNSNFKTADGKTPKVAKITQVMINEGAVAFAAYRNNELDVYGVAAEDLRSIQSDADLSKQVVDGPQGCSFYIGFNVKKAPFDDKNGRVAFSKSCDSHAYINNAPQTST